MNLNLIGKKAMVCGGSRGIGLASAKELADLGAEVTLVSRSSDHLKKAINDLSNEHHQKHQYLVADFSKPEQVREVMDEATATKEFHILVNNTGGPAGGAIVNASTDEFIKAFDMHLICNHIIARSVIPGMKTLGYGRIINIISTSVKQPLNGLGVSNTIRGSVANWSKTLSNEVAKFNITVNNVLPGATETDRLKEIIAQKAKKSGQSIEQVKNAMQSIIPMQRFAKPEEVGAAVAFLASPAASYINGINLPVDGGRTKSL